MEYRKRFYEYYFSSHGARYGETSKDAMRRHFPTLNSYFGKFLPANKDSAILDLGCGNGNFVYWLETKGYKNVSGVDMSPEQVSLAKNLGISNIHLGGAKEFLHERQNQYDLIVARDLIEHLSKDEVLELSILIEKSMKPHGLFVFQTVNAGNPLWGRLRHGDFTHELAFTKTSLEQLFAVVGLENLEMHPQRPVIHGPTSLVRYILWRLIELACCAYLLIETGSTGDIFTQNIIGGARKKDSF